MWDVVTREFVGDDNGSLRAVRCARVAWKRVDGQWKMEEVPDSEFELKAELVTLAMGFVHPVYQGMLEDFDLALDQRGNVAAGTSGDKAYRTNVEGVFSAGDMRRGQSLVVWAIHEGRECAEAVNQFLLEDDNLSR